MRIEETTLATGKETYKLLADEGKVLMRKSDGQIFGDTLVLGYTWYLAGVKLLDEDGNPSPHWEIPDDYTEVDKPEEPDEDEIQEPEEVEEPEVIEDLTELERIRREKLKALSKYNDSPNVNEFFVNGKAMWFTLEERLGMSHAAEQHKKLGHETMTYVYDGEDITLPIATWEYLLAVVELYAQDCYNVTARHMAAIKKLDKSSEIFDYDYTVGYPEKLQLTF